MGYCFAIWDVYMIIKTCERANKVTIARACESTRESTSRMRKSTILGSARRPVRRWMSERLVAGFLINYRLMLARSLATDICIHIYTSASRTLTLPRRPAHVTTAGRSTYIVNECMERVRI